MWSSLAASGGVLLAAMGILMFPSTSVIALVAGAGISGIGQGACRPAYQALVPTVVADEKLQPANAAMSLSVRITVLAGPALTSALALVAGIPIALMVLASLWIASAAVPPWRTLTKSVTGVSVVRIWSDLRDGLAEARRHPWFLSGLAALTAVIFTGYSATGVLLPLIAALVFDGCTLLVTAIAAYTSGAILGAILLSWIRFRPRGWWALLGLALSGIGPLSLLWAESMPVVLLAYLIAGLGLEIFNVQWFTAIQTEVPRDRLARISSIDFLCSYGLAPVGLALIVPMSSQYGFEVVLWSCATVCLIAPLLAAMVPGSRSFTSARSS